MISLMPTNRHYSFAFWLINVLLAYVNVYLFTLNSSFDNGKSHVVNYLVNEPRMTVNAADIVLTEPITIGVIHQMTAMGVDEVDQDIRMAHRQNYRRLRLKYPNVTINYVFAVKEDKEGNTNIGFETQFPDVQLGRHFEHVLWSDAFYNSMGNAEFIFILQKPTNMINHLGKSVHQFQTDLQKNFTTNKLVNTDKRYD